MALIGGNRADYTLRTAMIGVNNTVTGTSRRPVPITLLLVSRMSLLMLITYLSLVLKMK